jgi:hypothetical protein
MGYSYSVTLLVDPNGENRDVRIPNLRSHTGQAMWRKMKAAVYQTNTPLETDTEDDILAK